MTAITMTKRDITALEKDLAEAQGRASARIFEDADHVLRTANRLLAQLVDAGATKASLSGILIEVTSDSGKLPSAYKYKKSYTEVKLTFDGSKFRYSGYCRRRETFPTACRPTCVASELPKAAYDLILNNIVTL